MAKKRAKKPEIIKISLGLSLIIIVLLGIFFTRINSKELNIKIINGKLSNNLASNTEEAGTKGIVSEVAVIQRKTGTSQFDDNNEPGNDKDAENNIVRSFDQVTWTIEHTMALKDPTSGMSYNGGMLQVKAELPETTANYVKWDLSSMSWAEDGVVSEDGRIFTANYTLSADQVTIPGKQNLVYVLKVLGAPNGLVLNPTFTANILGNEESETCSTTLSNDNENEINSPVLVSATPRLNIQLKRNTSMNYRSYFDESTGNKVESKTDNSIYGRMQGYGITLQLFNQEESQGLKGIEVPKGDITFDITFNEAIGTEDVTEEENYTPKMWDYKENSPSSSGNLGRNMIWLENNYTKHAYLIAPFNKGNNRFNYCNDGGTWEITQDAIKPYIYHVKVKEYKFDEAYKFPTNNGGDILSASIKYGKNIGCFSSGYIETIMQMPESVNNTSSIYMKAAISNINFTTLSDQNANEDKNLSDNSVNTSIVLYPKGGYSKSNMLYSDEVTSENFSTYSPYLLSSEVTAGDAYIAKDKELYIVGVLYAGSGNDNYARGVNILQKFDDKCFEPVDNIENSVIITKITSNTLSESGNIKALYAAKPNKEGWVNADEMQNTGEDKLIYFENYKDLKDGGYTCVGVLFENRSAKLYAGVGLYCGIKVKVKDTAQIGTTYQTINDVSIWENEHTFSWLNQTYTYDEINGLTYNNLSYPTPDSKLVNGMNQNLLSYIKTEYDENGQIVTGTHNGGYYSGNTLLIVGANQRIIIESIDENNNIKTNYDLGKNQNNAKFKITPTLSAAQNLQIENVTLKITTTLPKGITYKTGSSSIAEPEKISNADESTTLVWYIYNAKVNEVISPITFNSEIDIETPNGTQFNIETIIAEEIADGQNTKIGNSSLQSRTSTTSIQIINLESYNLYKEVKTPIIEVNGEGIYKITASNKTDNNANNFQLLDILPYNGDGRGTSFNGNYKVEKIEIKQINNLDKSEITNNPLNLYVTENENVRDGVTCKDENLVTNSIWSLTSSGANLDRNITAFALTGTLKAKSKIEITITLKTSGNKPGDIYQNIATAQTNTETAEMESPIVKIEVIKRALDGHVWLDSNSNGLIDQDETYIENAKLRLLNQDGTIAKNADGNEFELITTNATGYYKFENITKGNYKVELVYDNLNNDLELTSKGIGLRKEINSKFNNVENNQNAIKAETDIITTLNNIEHSVIKEEFVNAGLRYKNSRVLVHHYIEGTTNKVPLKNGGVASDEEITGRVNDSYETNIAEVPEYYELVSMPENSQGNMTLDTIVVTYYYKLKQYPYTVNYYDKETGEKIRTTKNGENKAYGAKVTISSEKLEVENELKKYTYVGSDVAGDENKTELTIGREANQNVINLYYTKKKGNVIVKYIDENTGTKISSIISKTDKIDETYVTEKKTIEGYTFVKNTANTTGVYTLQSIETPIEVIYYYKKNTKVTVKHVDKTTDKEIPNDDKTESKEEIVGLEGDQYRTSSKNFKNYVLLIDELPANKEGEMSANEIVVTYYYKQISGGVIEKHIDDITGEILYNKTHEGKEGDNYEIVSKTFESYELIQSKLPDNSTGKMTIEPIIVNYYYRYPTKVIVKYIDKITNKEITIEDGKSTKEQINGYLGQNYNTNQKSFDGYDIIEEELPRNAKGIMTKEEIEVKYYYRQISGGVIENHYDIKTGEKLVEEKTYDGHVGDDYSIAKKVIEGYDFVKLEKDKQQQNNIDSFTGKMTQNKIVIDLYYKKQTKVIVKYVDDLTKKEITDQTIINGYVGDNYSTTPKEIQGYDLLTSKLPKNDKGEMTKEQIEVVYYYKKKAEVEIQYLEEGTEKEIALKEEIKGYVEDEYKTEVKDIKYYNFKTSSQNTNGKMKDEKIIVKYYYIPKAFNLKVEKLVDSFVIDGETQKVNKVIGKKEIKKSKVNSITFKVKYLIKVTNDGELIGSATLKENIPNGFNMLQKDNSKWNISGNEAIVDTENIEPGDKKEYEVVLTWNNNIDNFGLKQNKVELLNFKNEAGFEEKSIEDNNSKAELLLSIATGRKENSKAVLIIVSMVVVGLMLIIIKNKNNK